MLLTPMSAYGPGRARPPSLRLDPADRSVNVGRLVAPARAPLSRTRRRRLTWKSFLKATIPLALLHATGLIGDLGLLALSMIAPVVAGIGVRRHRPSPAWPWALLILAGVVWSIAGAVRAAVGSTGDLTADRSLLPDLFALAGYSLFAIALLKMLKAQGQATRSRSLVLDGAILAISSMLICWVGLIAPVLFRLDAAWIAKLSIVMYPPISAYLVFVAARLAFGTAVSGTAQRLLLVGMMTLLLGDAAFVPLESGLVDDLPGRVLELPYALAYVLISAAALHPSMLDTVRRKTSGPVTDDRRFVLMAVALLTPALMLFVWSPSTIVERAVVGGLAVVLATAAIVRVVLAARAQAAVEKRLERQATTDELTGLINRPAALEFVNRQLDRARAEEKPVALLFIDLDRFKLVNDSYGHAVGDDLLLAAADRLRTSVGPHDTVARLSGDEFLVIMSATDVVRARELASRICEVFAEPFELIGTAWVTASVGVVVATDAAETDATSLIRDADTAMYEAKAAGRGGFVMFNPAMRAASERQLELHNGLHLAIERDEFDVHYQVIIDANSGTVDGVEALVRWESPNGRVPPDQFISLAEDAGLISTIGEIVLTRACDQVARWRKLPGCGNLSLSVNVSARQVLDGDIVALVDDVLTTSGLTPDALWLEITESVMMADTLETVAALGGLRALGVHLSVDDFGTGNSSLSYLQRFPIEQVKIDRQFVAGMGDHSEDAAVVAAVIGIAQALSLSIVAEGVETVEQEQRLIELGCGLLQGYLFSRPVPAIDLGPILMERNQFQCPPSSGRRR